MTPLTSAALKRRLSQIIELHERGFTTSAIGAQFGLTRRWVSALLRRASLRPPHLAKWSVRAGGTHQAVCRCGWVGTNRSRSTLVTDLAKHKVVAADKLRAAVEGRRVS